MTRLKTITKDGPEWDNENAITLDEVEIQGDVPESPRSFADLLAALPSDNGSYNAGNVLDAVAPGAAGALRHTNVAPAIEALDLSFDPEAGAMAGADIITAGHVDEIGGLARGGVDDYAEERDRLRSRRDRIVDRSPGSYYATQALLGGMTAPLLPGGAVVGATLEGGLAGAGYSDESMTENPLGVLSSMTVGGALGGGMAALPALIGGAAREAGGLRNDLARGADLVDRQSELAHATHGAVRIQPKRDAVRAAMEISPPDTTRAQSVASEVLDWMDDIFIEDRFGQSLQGIADTRGVSELRRVLEGNRFQPGGLRGRLTEAGQSADPAEIFHALDDIKRSLDRASSRNPQVRAAIGEHADRIRAMLEDAEAFGGAADMVQQRINAAYSEAIPAMAAERGFLESPRASTVRSEIDPFQSVQRANRPGVEGIIRSEESAGRHARADLQGWMEQQAQLARAHDDAFAGVTEAAEAQRAARQASAEAGGFRGGEPAPLPERVVPSALDEMDANAAEMRALIERVQNPELKRRLSEFVFSGRMSGLREPAESLTGAGNRGAAHAAQGGIGEAAGAVGANVDGGSLSSDPVPGGVKETDDGRGVVSDDAMLEALPREDLQWLNGEIEAGRLTVDDAYRIVRQAYEETIAADAAEEPEQ